MAAVTVALALAACGGGGHATTSAPAASTTAGAPAASTTTKTATSSAPEVPTTARATRTATPPARNVRIPASFIIGAGGRLAPPQVAVPRDVPVQLSFVNHDRRAHMVTAGTYKAQLQPEDQATKVLSGLRGGATAIVVDGRQEGQIVVGANPGP